jgi:LPS-assembly protein
LFSVLTSLSQKLPAILIFKLSFYTLVFTLSSSFYNTKAFANNNLQLKLGDHISIFSNKAYRRGQGQLFEAVGNVVIVLGEETLYGESATFYIKEGHFKVEGNVRFISKDLTIYGSKLEYDIEKGNLLLENARISTSNFYIVAKKIERTKKNTFYAQKAEYSTCKDCPESWSIMGDEISLTMGEYVTIKHALFKINTVNIMYIPYIVLPAKKDRETGLLFPSISNRFSEGISIGFPWYWAMANNKDMTISPMFWAKRGYGVDYEYRHIFNENSWTNFNVRMLDDEIYQPGKLTEDQSGDKYFRYFSVLENHQNYKNFYTQHLRLVNSRDLDLLQDYSDFTDPHIRGSEIGAQGFVDFRFPKLHLSFESQYKRNQLYSESSKFDDSYVQVLPKVAVNSMPYKLVESDVFLFKNINIGFDTDFTVFKQNNFDESSYLRNARRVNFNPYVDWSMGSIGAGFLSTNIKLDYQHYDFFATDEENFSKVAVVFKTELTFSLEKVFGLAYEEKIPVQTLKQKKSSHYLYESKGDSLAFKILNPVKKDNIVGELESFENSLIEDILTKPKYSYKHTQEFKIIHHQIGNEEEKGSSTFRDQINTSEGWFDYIDAIRSDESTLGSNQTRTVISPNNTLEFQWNNLLIKKSPKKFNFFDDYRFLRDNFSYSSMGYFKVSQGVELDSDAEEKLTRLFVSTGYTANDWRFSFDEYYFHSSNNHIFRLNSSKDLDLIRLFGNLNFNTFDESELKTVSYGFHLRTSDKLGFTLNFEYDLENRSTLRSLYALDYIPSNNCWKLSLTYRKTIVDNRISFDWNLNLGDSTFQTPNKDINRL